MATRIVRASAAVLVAIGILGCIAVLAAILIGQQPTKGPRIGQYAAAAKALLVVDVQEDFTGPDARAPFPVPDALGLIANINAVIERASGSGFVICYIRQRLPQGFLFQLMTGNRGIINTPGVEPDRRLRIVNDGFFPKAYADAFSNRDLELWLVKRQVNEVYLCGLDAVHCVDATARGAVNRGYRVVVIEDAVATVSSKPMAEIIAGYKRRGINAIAVGAFLKGN